MLSKVVLIGVLMLACATLARAQETEESRADVLRQARLEKQQAVEAYKPNEFEMALKAIEKSGVPLITRDGVYLKLGSLTTGSGFAYGAGYRSRRLFEGDGMYDVWAGASMTKYWAFEGRLHFPRLVHDRIDVQAYARRHEYPQEDYFGLGPSSLRGNQSDYGLKLTTVGGRLALRPASKLAIGGGAEYVKPRVANGTDDGLPSITDRFDVVTAPGIAAQPSYVRSVAFVDLDWRQPLNARKGGWYRAEFSQYTDRDQMGFAFNRLDLDVRHFISFLSERRILFGRVSASMSEAESGQQVPFYLMPTLGGHDSLRGFRAYRFRGPHSLLLQGEYRFEIWSGLDGALFYDAGKVAMRRSQLNLSGLESDYGFGFRFNTDNGIVLRVDSAFGSRDGKHLWIVFGGTF